MPPLSPARRGLGALGALGVTAIILTLGVAPMLTSGADHLDAPSLGSISVNPDDSLNFSKVRGPLDINDLYVFQGASTSRTVLAMTVNPAINLAGPSTFQTGTAYRFNIDTDGDLRADALYTARFGGADSRDIQHYVVRRNGKTVATGFTTNALGQTKGEPESRMGVKVFAGVRSDPFFFDLLGFLGSVKGQGTRTLNDGNESDFFAGLNTLAIVIELPNSALLDDDRDDDDDDDDDQNGADIGVWATTSTRDGQADQMGRPAINTVFNSSSADKEAFNVTAPANQRTAMGGKFRDNVIGVLQALGGYSATDAGTIADILLPDILTYTVGTPAAGPLNGRGLADDVIDAELGIVTNGAIPTDGVPAHGDYLSSFPYLGLPH